jgi:hypothetical protein
MTCDPTKKKLTNTVGALDLRVARAKLAQDDDDLAPTKLTNNKMP